MNLEDEASGLDLAVLQPPLFEQLIDKPLEEEREKHRRKVKGKKKAESSDD